MKNVKSKPLATFGTSPRVEIHRGRFHAFESTKYLNLAALKRASKARIEIGRVEAGGFEATLVAEVRRGMITALTPLACKGCGGDGGAQGKRKRAAGGVAKKAIRLALEHVRDRGYPVVKLPIPITKDLEIPIGPVIIVFGPGWDVCIVIEWPDGEICIYCLFSSGLCVGPIVVE